MYFENFQKIVYGFTIQGKYVQFALTDITENVRFKKQILADTSLFHYYTIQDGETPERIAEKLYGDPQLHWVIMLANDRIDYLNDFPRTQQQLYNYATRKYGNNIYGVHHYVNAAGYIVSKEQVGAVSVSNIDYESQLNESKRQLRVISADYLQNILAQIKDLIA